MCTCEEPLLAAITTTKTTTTTTRRAQQLRTRSSRYHTRETQLDSVSVSASDLANFHLRSDK